MLPRWPARLCFAVLLALVLLATLASRSDWPSTLRRDLADLRGSAGPLVGDRVLTAASRVLAAWPAPCEQDASAPCLLIHARLPIGCTQWPVHLLLHAGALACWIGFAAPLLLWRIRSGSPACVGQSVPSSAGHGLQPMAGGRQLLAWVPLFTLVWACLPGAFALAPVWAVIWCEGAFHLAQASVPWRDD